MIIDSHQHFWVYDPIKYSWIDDAMAAIRKDFLPADLKAIYADQQVDGCVAVQVDQTTTETDFLVELAAENRFIKGVVGWVDLQSPNINELLEKRSHDKIVKGFRHIVQGESDPNFLFRNEFQRGITALGHFEYTYDILVFPHQLVSVLEFVKKFPQQKFVIDHLAKPYVKEGFYDGWAAVMQLIAECENVYCKLSGLITEADYKHWETQDLQPYMELVLEAFGPARLLFGSDWPVCLVAGTFSEVKKLTEDFIKKLSGDEQQQIMGLNAINFYNL